MFEKNIKEENTLAKSLQQEEYEYKVKFGFINELQSNVRTDEEYAKFKGYIQ